MVAEMHDPFAVGPHHAVEHVAVHDEVALAVFALMQGAVLHVDIAEGQPELQEGPQELIMVADDIGDFRAALGGRQDAADDVRVGLRPEPFLAQAPAIDDVAGKVKLLRGVRLEEAAKRLGLATGDAKVHIRDENRLVFRLGLLARCGHPKADSLISYRFCDSSGANM